MVKSLRKKEPTELKDAKNFEGELLRFYAGREAWREKGRNGKMIDSLLEKIEFSQEALDTALLEACRFPTDKDTANAIIQLERKGANLDALFKQGNFYYTPLSVAIDHSNLKLVEFLLARGATVDFDSHAAFKIACQRNNPDIMKILKEYGVDLHMNNGEALWWPAGRGHKEGLRFALEEGIDPLAHNGKAYKLAAYHGHRETLEMLLEQIPASAKERERYIPFLKKSLASAIEGEKETCIEALLKYDLAHNEGNLARQKLDETTTDPETHLIRLGQVGASADLGKTDHLATLLRENTNEDVAALRIHALLRSAACGNEDSLRYVVDNFPQDLKGHLTEATMIAAQNKHFSLTPILAGAGKDRLESRVTSLWDKFKDKIRKPPEGAT